MLSVVGGGLQLRFEVDGDSRIGECRRAAQRLAQTNGLDETTVGRVGIVASELATNLVRHASGGELLLQALQLDGTMHIELLAIDRGPGMEDVQRCLSDGYSTGGTLGTGLGAVRRLSSAFDIYSVAGQGTVVLARVATQAARQRSPLVSTSTPERLELGAVCVPMPGETECGDAWRLVSEGETAAALVVDGLGHGPFAAEAARAAVAAFVAAPLAPPTETLQRMHRATQGTRGAAGACARLVARAGTVEYAGIGNISGHMIAPQRSNGMVSHNGTLGSQLLRVQQFSYSWPREARIVMHSDGISSRWSLSAYEGLHARHSALIAAVLYRDYRRSRDDATVLVLERSA